MLRLGGCYPVGREPTLEQIQSLNDTREWQYKLWVNDIPVEELPKLIDPSLECHNPDNFNNMENNSVNAVITINDKKFEIICDPWTPAI